LMMKLDLAHVMRLRLVIARFGEMDVARWWNTKGMLARTGATVLQRGFPRTFPFAQARVVFAVAKSRCQDLFDSPNCITLWNLPSEVEERFDEEWYRWLEQSEEWEAFFKRLGETRIDDLLTLLEQTDLLSAKHRETVLGLGLSVEARAFALPDIGDLNDDAVSLLAASFSRGDIGKLAIPYARLGTNE